MDLKKQGYHLSDIWVAEDLSKTFSMADVRSMHHFASQSPVRGKKIVFIHGIDSARIEVLNGLLKIIEEPPSFLQIILLSESAQILPTILSRVVICNNFNSAKIISREEIALAPQSSFDKWKNVLDGLQSDLETEKAVAKKLLYLHTLGHSTVQTENVLEGYSKQNQND